MPDEFRHIEPMPFGWLTLGKVVIAVIGAIAGLVVYLAVSG